MKKRILAVFLCAVMVLSMLPASALAIGDWGGTGVAAAEGNGSTICALGNNLVVRDGGSGLTQLYYADAAGSAAGAPIDLTTLGFSGSTGGADLSAATLYATYDSAYGGDSTAFQNLDVVLSLESGTLSSINGGNINAKANSITVRMSGGTLTTTGRAIAADHIYLSGGTITGSLSAETAIYLSGSPAVGSDTTGIAVGAGQQVYLTGALSGANIRLNPTADLDNGTVLVDASSYTITDNDLAQLHLVGDYADGKELYLEGNQVKLRTTQPEPQYVAYINTVGYESLGAAVNMAQPGQTIAMAANDNTSQEITIEKALTIDLAGFQLTDTSLVITAGTVAIGDSQGTGSIHGRVHVSGAAAVTLNDLNLTWSGAGPAILLQGGTLTVSGGTYTAAGVLSAEAGKAVIENGTFTGTDYAVSFTGADYTPGDITIYQGSFSASNAFQAPGYDSTAAQAEALFLKEGSGSYIVDEENFNPAHVMIALSIYAAQTGGQYGSTDGSAPAEILLLGTRSYTLKPDVQGGDGSAMTYTWYKNGQLLNITGSQYTISNFGKKNIGLYSVTVTQGQSSVTLYWQVGSDLENENIVAIIEGVGYLHLTSDIVSTAEPGDTILIMKNYVVSQGLLIPGGVTLELNGCTLSCGTNRIRIGGSGVIISDRTGSGLLEAFVTISSPGTTLTVSNANIKSSTAIFQINTTSFKLTIDGGNFESTREIILSPYASYGDIIIREGSFQSTDTNFIFSNLSVRTAAALRANFLDVTSGSYIVDEEHYDPKSVTIARGIYAAQTGAQYGSTDQGSPAQLMPVDGESFSLTPNIQGGDGSAITYTWYKNSREISGQTSSVLTLSDYGAADDGLYTVTATQGERSVKLYWQLLGSVTPKTIVAHVGSVGYETLAAAVEAANPGDTVTMVADDSTTQLVTINKDLTLELDGHDLFDTRLEINGGSYVTLNDRKGSGWIGGTSSVEGVTISIFDATVVMNNLHVYSYTGKGLSFSGRAIHLYAEGTLTINGGTYCGRGSSGDGIRVEKGAVLTINGGTFQALGNGVGVSYRYDPPENLIIHEGYFYAAEAKSAFYVGTLSYTPYIEDPELLKQYFLQEEIGNYFVDTSDPMRLVIRSGIYVPEGLVGNQYGSASEQKPAEVYLTEGERFTLEAEIWGANDSIPITYTWYHGDEKINGETGSTLTIDAYDLTADRGTYTVEASSWKGSTVKAYWQVGTAYEVYVGGTQVTEGNAADILGDGTASYNVENKTLTLNGLTLENQGVQSSVQGDAIFASILSRDDLHIVLAEGSENTITTTADVTNAMVFGVAGVQENGTPASVSISGPGKLTIQESLSQRTSYATGIFGGNSSVENAALEVSLTGDAHSIGVGATSLEIQNASVHCSGAEIGLGITGDLSVQGSSDLRLSGGTAAMRATDGSIAVENTLSIWGSTTENDFANLTRANISADEKEIQISGQQAKTVEIRENDAVPYVDEDGGERTLTGAYTVMNENITTWESGWYVVEDSVIFHDAITVTGDVKLILMDGASLYQAGHITIEDGGTLTVYGQSASTGTLLAGNGILGGTICIAGGQVTAAAAGITGQFRTGSSSRAVIFADLITDQSGKADWRGLIFEGGEGRIYGDAYTVPGSLTIPQGQTLLVENGKTLVSASDTTSDIDNNGAIKVLHGGTYEGLQPNGNAVTYQIDWDTDGDKDVDDTSFVAYGDTPYHANGEKAATAEFTYEFTNWTPAIAAVDGTAQYTADFQESRRSYEVTVTQGEGYTVTYSGNTTVAYGDVFTFTVEIADGFDSGNLAVSANGTPLTAQPDGSYSVAVTGPTEITVDGVADKDGPVIQAGWQTALDSGSFYADDGKTYVTMATETTITIQAEDPSGVQSITYRLGNGEDVTVAPDQDGEYSFVIDADFRGTLTVSATDQKSNASSPVTYYEFCVELPPLAAPSVDTGSYDGGWSRNPVTLTPSATPISGIDHYEYSNDGGESWEILQDSSLTLSEDRNATDYIFRVVSNANNVSAESEPVTVQIDKNAPGVTLSGNTTDYLQEDTLEITPIIGLSGISQVELQRNNGTWETLSPSDQNPNVYTCAITANGVYTVRVTSGAGMTYTESITYSRIDRVKPVVALDSNGYESGIWTNAAVTLSAASTAPNLGTTTYQYKEDDGEWQAYTGPITISEETTGTRYTFQAVSASGVESDEVSITVKIDRTAPDGNITFEKNSVKELINQITFGLFFSKDIDVEITATDDLGEVDSIEFYRSDKILTEDQVQSIMDWTKTDGKFSVTAEDQAQFIYYVKITDKAGNCTCFGSNGATFDLTFPVIDGVQNGETCYVTQVVTVWDENLDSVTLDGNAAVSPMTLQGNVEATYTVAARDKAGNETTVTVTMKPVSSLAEPIKDLTTDNVTSADKEAVEVVKEQVASVDTEDATAAEKEALQEILDKCDELLEKIQEVEEVLSELETRFNEIDFDNITPDDKETLETLKEDIEQALTDYEGNLTEDEQAQLEDNLDRINDILESLERVQAVEDAIEALPDTVEPDDTAAEEEILAAQEEYDALSEWERSLVREDLVERLQRLLEELVDYAVIEGNGSKWQKGAKTGLCFTANGAYSKFTGIEVDGKAVEKSNYTAVSGSTIITLKPEYLENLSLGDHTFTVQYTDGEASATFTITKKPAGAAGSGTQSPHTGDNRNMLLWLALLFASGCAFFSMLIYKKKRFAKR